MKLFLALIFLSISISLTACGSGETANTAADPSKPVKAKPSAAQQALISKAVETPWDEQGMSWKLPADWTKVSVNEETFSYTSPDGASFMVKASPLSANVSPEASVESEYQAAAQMQKDGKYESARITEIAGMAGVEIVESNPEDQSAARRHQWIAYRKNGEQLERLNVTAFVQAGKYEEHADEFTAILYSLKAKN